MNGLVSVCAGEAQGDACRALVLLGGGLLLSY